VPDGCIDSLSHACIDRLCNYTRPRDSRPRSLDLARYYRRTAVLARPYMYLVELGTAVASGLYSEDPGPSYSWLYLYEYSSTSVYGTVRARKQKTTWLLCGSIHSGPTGPTSTA
jgi:hypothetical protein